MDKWRFAHFEEEKGGERVARKGCFLGWFIFNSVARRRSSFSALPVQPSLLTAFRKYVAFLLFLRRDARRNFATETKLHVTLFFGRDLTARLLLIVGHALKNFTFTEIGSCENQKNFSRGEEVEELFRWIVSVSIVPLFSLHRFCLVICFLSKIRRVILYWLNSCSVVTME